MKRVAREGLGAGQPFRATGGNVSSGHAVATGSSHGNQWTAAGALSAAS